MGRPEAGAHFNKDRGGNPVAIRDHLIVPEANDLPTQGFQAGCPHLVALAIDVLAAVELDRDPG